MFYTPPPTRCERSPVALLKGELSPQAAEGFRPHSARERRFFIQKRPFLAEEPEGRAESAAYLPAAFAQVTPKVSVSQYVPTVRGRVSTVDLYCLVKSIAFVASLDREKMQSPGYLRAP